jgi:hypothetical protein
MQKMQLGKNRLHFTLNKPVNMLFQFSEYRICTFYLLIDLKKETKEKHYLVILIDLIKHKKTVR